MKFFASFCAILLVSLCSADLYSEYDHFAALDELASYKLYWSVDREQQEVSFAVEVRTNGWVGFGISSGNGKMKGSDLVIGWVKDCKGYLTDRYADGYSVPVLDKQQDYELTGFSEKDGTTVLKFKRKIDTCDERDRKIMGGTTKVVFAYHSEDPKSPMDLQKHSVRGQRTLMLLNAFKGSSSHEDLEFFDVRNNEIGVPPNDTTYWCHPVKLPTFDKKYHIVKVAPTINEGNEGLLHHILVYICDHNSFNESALDKGHICRHPNMPRDLRNCFKNSLLMAWAIGLKEFLYPPDAGYPIGTADGPKIVLMEIHYDNPKKRSDFVDSSGLRFYYTTPRKYDAGVLMTGWIVTPSMMIPPREKDWATSGYCPKQCTQRGFADTGIAEGGVNVFAVGLHTHLAGRKARLRHIRNGRELPEIVRDDNYDFNFQEMQHINKEVKVLPGDDLITECVYNTMDRAERTTGGESTREEMCLSFVMYYPRTNMSRCWSTDNGYYAWLYKYGITGNYSYYFKTFPAQWNKTLANDLKMAYNITPNTTVLYRIDGKRFVVRVPKPKILIPLPKEMDNCTASNMNRTNLLHHCAGGGARGLGTSIMLAALMAAVALIIM